MQIEHPASSPDAQAEATPTAPGRVPAPRGIVILAFLAITWCLASIPVRWEWDSTYLYYGLQELMLWARGGFQARRVAAGPFPPFQYLTGLPATLAAAAGLPLNVYAYWALCSLGSLLASAWVLFRVGRRFASPRVGWLLVVVILSGPLITYAPSTFNELPATLATLCFAAVVVGRGGPFVSGVLFVAAAMTKEIAAPLLVPLWLAGLWMRRGDLGRAGITRHAIAMAAAFFIAAAVHVAFNLLRYDTFMNAEYLVESLLVRRWDRRAQNIAAVWLAPNGGVVPFWPTLAAVVAGAGVLGATASRTSRDRRERASPLIPALAVLATLGGLTVGLSGWHQPFGWWCWGPRLLLPWLPAALVVLVRGYPRAFDRVAGLLFDRPAAFVATAVLACVLTLPHLLMAARPASMYEFFMADHRFPTVPARTDAEPHYARNVYLAWQKWPPLLLRPIAHIAEPRQAIATGAYLAALVVLLAQGRSHASRSKGRPPAGSKDNSKDLGAAALAKLSR